jgi:hypothetical protein
MLTIHSPQARVLGEGEVVFDDMVSYLFVRIFYGKISKGYEVSSLLYLEIQQLMFCDLSMMVVCSNRGVYLHVFPLMMKVSVFFEVAYALFYYKAENYFVTLALIMESVPVVHIK